MPVWRDQHIRLVQTTNVQSDFGGLQVHRMGNSKKGRTYSFQVTVDYSIAVEVLKALRSLAELQYSFGSAISRGGK